LTSKFGVGKTPVGSTEENEKDAKKADVDGNKNNKAKELKIDDPKSR